jgi:hypothetical protein
MDWRNPLSYLEVATSFAPIFGHAGRKLWNTNAVQTVVGKTAAYADNALAAGKGLISKATAVGDDIWDDFNRSIVKKGAIGHDSPTAVFGLNLGRDYADDVLDGGNRIAIVGHGGISFPDTTIIPKGTSLIVPRHGIEISDLTGRVLENMNPADLVVLVNASSPKVINRLINKQLRKIGDGFTIVEDGRVLIGSKRRARVLKDLKGLRMVEAGGEVQDYMIHAPKGLTIYSNSTSVIKETRLSDILKPNVGVCVLATCTVQF